MGDDRWGSPSAAVPPGFVPGVSPGVCRMPRKPPRIERPFSTLSLMLVVLSSWVQRRPTPSSTRRHFPGHVAEDVERLGLELVDVLLAVGGLAAMVGRLLRQEKFSASITASGVPSGDGRRGSTQDPSQKCRHEAVLPNRNAGAGSVAGRPDEAAAVERVGERASAMRSSNCTACRCRLSSWK